MFVRKEKLSNSRTLKKAERCSLAHMWWRFRPKGRGSRRPVKQDGVGGDVLGYNQVQDFTLCIGSHR